MTRYISKQDQQEQEIMKFNLDVLKKNIASIKSIEKIVSFGIKLVYNYITGEWARTDCEGPVFLIKSHNSSLKLIIMNQIGKKNYIEEIRDHMEFQLKTNVTNGTKNYYLNVKIPDSVCSTLYLSIWTTDQKVEEIYQMIANQLKIKK